MAGIAPDWDQRFDRADYVFGTAPAAVLTPARLSELYGCAMTVVRHTGRYHAFSNGASDDGQTAAAVPATSGTNRDVRR